MIYWYIVIGGGVPVLWQSAYPDDLLEGTRSDNKGSKEGAFRSGACLTDGDPTDGPIPYNVEEYNHARPIDISMPRSKDDGEEKGDQVPEEPVTGVRDG